MYRSSAGDPYQVDAEVVADLAAKAALPHDTDGAQIPFVIVDANQKVHPLSDLLENPLAPPTRIRASADFMSVDSFLAYVGQFRDDTTQLFADQQRGTVSAYLDYHAPGRPSRVTHRAALQMVKSREWNTWHGKNKQPFQQVAFAEFLEDNLLDIAEPDSATILEAVTFLEAKKDANFLSGTDLRSGAIQFKYEETIETKGRNAGMIPDGFVLRIPPYEHSAPVSIPAKLRFRINEGKLTFHYVLQQPENVLDAAFNSVLEDVQKSLEMTALFGTVNPHLKY